VSLEAGITRGWEWITGSGGMQLGIDRFGASAPAPQLAEAVQFTAPLLAQKIRKRLAAW